jgi:hypothetical protein
VDHLVAYLSLTGAANVVFAYQAFVLGRGGSISLSGTLGMLEILVFLTSCLALFVLPLSGWTLAVPIVSIATTLSGTIVMQDWFKEIQQDVSPPYVFPAWYVWGGVALSLLLVFVCVMGLLTYELPEGSPSFNDYLAKYGPYYGVIPVGIGLILFGWRKLMDQGDVWYRDSVSSGVTNHEVAQAVFGENLTVDIDPVLHIPYRTDYEHAFYVKGSFANGLLFVDLERGDEIENLVRGVSELDDGRSYDLTTGDLLSEVFWAWFSDHTANADIDKLSSDEFLSMLGTELDRVKSGLNWKIRHREDEDWELVISSEGLEHLAGAVQHLADTAPDLKRWRVAAEFTAGALEH